MANELETFLAKQSLPAANFLAHYGIKGMRWGIRRSDAELARAKGESEDAFRARKTSTTIAKTKSLSSVNDSDLSHLINRINLEKRYSEITQQTKAAPFSALDKRVKKLLGFGATVNTAIQFADSPAGRLLAQKLNFTKATSLADQANALKRRAEDLAKG